jgi:transcriptional regulator GlxA family with amidase domain
MKNYIFFHKDGRCRRQEADPSRPETLPFQRDEIRKVYLDCTEQFLFPRYSVLGQPVAGNRRKERHCETKYSSTTNSAANGLPYRQHDLVKLQELLDCIAVRYKEKLTFDFALSMMSMSKSRFCDFFRHNTGISFVACINKVRTEKAACLLMETELTVESIGYDCGFDSPSSFYKCFKAHYGVSPARFRGELSVES